MNSIIILTGESGSGKDTICRYLTNLGRQKIIACTTRQKRPSEQDGIDYYFMTHEEFQKKRNDFFHGIFEYREVLIGGNPEYFGSEEVPFTDGKQYVTVLDDVGVAAYWEKYGSDACFIVKLDVPEPVRKERAWQRDHFNMPMMGKAWNAFCREWDERKADDDKRFVPNAYHIDMQIKNNDNPMRVALRIAAAAEMDAKKDAQPVPCRTLEKTWEHIVDAYKFSIKEKKTPVDCISEVFRSEGIWNTICAFALVVSMKQGDGRINRKYRQDLARIPLDGDVFYSNIDAIHSAHIGNLLYCFL